MLQEYEQYIFAEYNSVIQVENVYEEILFQTLLDESLKGNFASCEIHINLSWQVQKWAD